MIGATNDGAARFAGALALSSQHALPRYESVQPPYNLASRSEFEKELQPLILRQGVGVISDYALASGLLTGKYRTAANLAESASRTQSAKKYLTPDACGYSPRWTRWRPDTPASRRCRWPG